MPPQGLGDAPGIELAVRTANWRQTELDGQLNWLDDDERRRIRRLINPEHRHRFAVAHCLLREALAMALGADPATFRFARAPCPVCGGPQGPPVLDPPGPVRFSLSYSEDLVLIALAASPVGVDIETVPAEDTWRPVAKLLPAHEQDELAALAPPLQAERFARLWTRREAALKALGVGLGHGLELEGGPGFDWPARLEVREVAVPPGFQAAVAVTGASSAWRSRAACSERTCIQNSEDAGWRSGGADIEAVIERHDPGSGDGPT